MARSEFDIRLKDGSKATVTVSCELPAEADDREYREQCLANYIGGLAAGHSQGMLGDLLECRKSLHRSARPRRTDWKGTMDTNTIGAWRAELGITADAPEAATPRYEIWRSPVAAGGLAIRCLACLQISCHPDDVAQRYCVRCAAFHDDP